MPDLSVIATLTFEPLLSVAAWVSLAVLSAVVVTVYAMRRPPSCSRSTWAMIVGLLVSSVAAVLVILLNPVWLDQMPPPPGKPLLTILLDESASMQQPIEESSKETRFRTAVEAAQALQDEVSDDFEVRIRSFAERSKVVDQQQLSQAVPAGLTTDLATPLMDSLVSDWPQGQAIVLLSDGIHNATATTGQALEAAEMAKARDAPVFSAVVGSDISISDLEVRVPRSQELSFVGQTIPVTVEVQQVGQVTLQVEVSLIDPDGETVVETVGVEADETAEVSFLVTPPSTGVFQYQVRSAAYPGEATSTNNSTTFQVRVVDEPVKALVLEGKPYWDTKFLLRMLTSDPALEVDCLVRVTPDRFLKRRLLLVDTTGEGGDESDSADEASELRFSREEETEFVDDLLNVLEDRERLDEYQLLLLGREAETYLSENSIENLRRWIADTGGALVCYRGAPVAQPDRELSRLLPIRWAKGRQMSTNESRFRVQVTERGKNLNWLRIGGRDGLKKLPALEPSAPTESIKPLAVVLGRSDTSDGVSPALTYQPYGTGKVVVVEGSGMWRWAFLAPEYQALEDTYGTLWQSLMRWLVSSGGLMPGEQMALQMDQVVFTENEPVSAVVLRRPELENEPLPTVQLISDSDEVLQSIAPIPVGDEVGIYEVFPGALSAGHYRLQMETGAADDADGMSVIHFDVRPDLREQLEVSARPELLDRISVISGGESLPLAELATVADRFDTYRQRSRPVQFQRILAWDRWWVLVGLVVLWAAQWTLRRRSGLV